MDWDELLSLITLGAVFPYLGAAFAHWLRKGRNHSSGADAPT